jgi:1-deoxy-D-xylulose-5-phosphate reductoisomerase
MMNKGLEIIEAHHLFGFPEDRIDVLIHPQSVVHSLVEYSDGSTIAQLGVNDMRSPILYALSWPARYTRGEEFLDLTRCAPLSFENPDLDRFPAIGLARAALCGGGELPAVLNAANEVAVATFLEGACPLPAIAATVEETLDTWAGRNRPLATIEQALEADRDARRLAADAVRKYRAAEIRSEERC